MTKGTKAQRFYTDIFYPALLFGCVGAITWAIRGTGGWGGFDGTIVPGMLLGITWYYLSYLRGIDARSTVFWPGFGMSLGGMLGYGLFVSWIQGMFGVFPGEYISISPWYGALWFALCGMAWGGITGIFLGWALGQKKVSSIIWIKRFLFLGGGALAGWIITLLAPTLFFPKYSEEFYTPDKCYYCVSRLYSTNQVIIVYIGAWLGLLLEAYLEKDRDTLLCGAVMGLVYGPAYLISALWVLMYSEAPGYTDWWKVWELTSGLFMGFLYFGLFYYYQKRLNKAEDEKTADPENTKAKMDEISIQTAKPKKWANISFLFGVFFFFVITWYGSTSRMGAFLGFYDVNEVNQYGFPIPRIYLFLSGLMIILIWMARALIKQVKSPSADYFPVTDIHTKMLRTLLFIGFIGSVTIWPASIEILYVLTIAGAVLAHNHLQQQYPIIER